MRSVWVVIVFVALIAWPRLADLGKVVTNDETIWRGRAHRYVTGLTTVDLPSLFSGGQPGVTTMLLAGLADQFHSLAASQAAIAVPVAVLLGINIILLARLTSWPLTMVAGALLALDPFFIAHSRIVHTDALLASFMLVALLLLALAWRLHSRRYLYLSAGAVALAILTKFFAAWLLVPLFTAAAARRFGPRKILPTVGSRGRVVLTVLGVLSLTVIVLWPVVLTPQEPISIVWKYSRLSVGISEYGKGADQPLYYLREWWFRITPITALLAAVSAVGLAIGGRGGTPSFPARRLMLWLAGSALVYGVLLSLSEQKADRYFLIGFLVTDIVAAAGLVWLAALVEQLVPRWKRERIALVAGVVLAGLLAWDVAALHPYYLVHRNRWAPAENTRKLGWGEGLERAAAWLTSRASSAEEEKQLPKVASQYIFALRENYAGPRDSLGHEYDAEDFRYVILYRTMFERGLEHEQTQYLKAYFTRGTCVWQLTANGLPHVWIFERLPAATRPGAGDTIQQYADLADLPECAEEEVVADPRARWVL